MFTEKHTLQEESDNRESEKELTLGFAQVHSKITIYVHSSDQRKYTKVHSEKSGLKYVQHFTTFKGLSDNIILSDP